jgi:hypothetical protein
VISCSAVRRDLWPSVLILFSTPAALTATIVTPATVTAIVTKYPRATATSWRSEVRTQALVITSAWATLNGGPRHPRLASDAPDSTAPPATSERENLDDDLRARVARLEAQASGHEERLTQLDFPVKRIEQPFELQ